MDVRVTGVERLQALLQSAERAGRDLSPLFRGPIDKSVTSMFQRQWKTRGVFGGNPWARLRPATRSARVRRGGNRGGVENPLWDTGEGKASFEKVGPRSYRVITQTTYARGSTLFRMALHQEGFTVRQWGGRLFRFPRRVAPRPPVPDPIPAEVAGVWARLIERHIAGPEVSGG